MWALIIFSIIILIVIISFSIYEEREERRLHNRVNSLEHRLITLEQEKNND